VRFDSRSRTIYVVTHHDPTPLEHDDDHQSVDPVDVLRAMLAISPEDAASAREDAAKATKPDERQEP
jgi:hypothetical protein